MSDKASINADLLRVHLVLNQCGHLSNHPADLLIAGAIQDARNAAQRDVLLILWQLYNQGINTKDQDEKLNACYCMLSHVLNRLEDLGAMTEEFLRRMFRYGVQALKMIVDVQSGMHGGRKLVIEKVVSEKGHFIVPPKSKSAKDKKAVRGNIAMGHLMGMLQRPMDDMDRFLMALNIIKLCDNKAMKAGMDGGSVIDLPEIKRHKTGPDGKTMEVDPRWEEETWSFVGCGICAVAQCLGHMFMRWPVEINGERVPLTGDDDPETLQDWRFVEEKEWDMTDGKKENHSWTPANFVVINKLVSESDEGSDTQSD